MKKIITVIGILLLLGAFLLTGCTRDEPEKQPDETKVTEAPTMPVEEDVHYFVNEMEYFRLYSVREDGTDLKLVVDKRCYSPWQRGDTVYYMTDSRLESYHIPTGTCTTLKEDVLFYNIVDDYLVYTVQAESYGELELYQRNLLSGKDTFITLVNSGRIWTGYGRVYFVNYDYSVGTECLFIYDLETGKLTEAVRDFYYIGSLMPTKTGVYFEAYSETKDGWFYAPADGSAYTPVALHLVGTPHPIHISDAGTLYISWDSETFTDTLRFADANGNDTALITAESPTYFYVDQISEDFWMLQQNQSIGWGNTDEYGYYDNYAFRINYRLMTGEGTLMPLDVTGEASEMFKTGNFPLLDSSTARIPVTTALYNLFVKNHGYEGSEPICSTTHGAWLNIADRKVDLALLAAPTPEEQAYLEEKGVTVEMKLYGGDGLVFIGNASNPVSDLTHEQILAIFRGEITNWSQVGGPDHPIIVYYRDEQSGSQRLFKSLVFKGLEVPDFEAMNQQGKNFYLMDDMSTIVDVILSEPYAIGYSIMTYLDEVYAEEELRIFEIEGVLPSPDTVADSTYRYHTQGYLVIRSDEPTNSPARRLFDWFGCPLSDDLLTDCGVTPLHDTNKGKNPLLDFFSK